MRTDDHPHEELKRLKKEVAHLTGERDLSKKAAAYLCPAGTLPRNTGEVRAGQAAYGGIYRAGDVSVFTSLAKRLLCLAASRPFLAGEGGCAPQRHAAKRI